MKAKNETLEHQVNERNIEIKDLKIKLEELDKQLRKTSTDPPRRSEEFQQYKTVAHPTSSINGPSFYGEMEKREPREKIPLQPILRHRASTERGQAVRTSSRLRTTTVNRNLESVTQEFSNISLNDNPSPRVKEMNGDLEFRRELRIINIEKDDKINETIIGKMFSFEFICGEMEKCIDREEKIRKVLDNYMKEVA